MHGTLSQSPNVTDATLPISRIQVGRRIKGLRGVERLADNIAANGLLHPVTLIKQGKQYALLAGRRRLEAVKSLGRREISARIVEETTFRRPNGLLGRVPFELYIEISEDRERDDYAPSEMYAAYKKLLPFAKEQAKERQRQGGLLKVAYANLAQAKGGSVAALIAKALNTSRGTLAKIVDIHESARNDPAYKKFVEELDRAGKIDPVFKEFASAKQRKEYARADKIDTDIHKTSYVRRRDIFQLGDHRLMCGDSTSSEDVEKLFAGIIPHLMVTDAPHGLQLEPVWRAEYWKRKRSRVPRPIPNDHTGDWQKAYDLFPGNVAYIWFPDKKTRDVWDGLEKSGFGILDIIDWIKPKIVIGRSRYHSQRESCFFTVRKRADDKWQGRRDQSNVWEISRDLTVTGHATQKPIECMARPMLNNSAMGDAVYDPFVGSGTTIIAAEIHGRCCYAMEIDPAFCEMAIRRWEKWTGKKATLVATSQTFDEVMKERSGKTKLTKAAA